MRTSDSLRKTYGETLVELGEKNKNIVMLEADLGNSTMSSLFGNVYPERYFQMGIAEQNMASVAAGLSLTGKIPFINSFAVFASGRAYDQIRSSITIASLNVKICGSSAGLSDYGDGKTHQSIDDIALMQVLPNMTVLSPCDAVETEQMVKAMVENKGPMYIRINRNDLPVVTDPNAEYHIGKMTQVVEGKDVVVFATGIMVQQSIQAAKQLKEEGIGVRVVNVSTIKPLDTKALLGFCDGVKAVVTAEEHNVIGGLGSIVAGALSKTRLPLDIIGVDDRYGTSAENYDILLKHYGLESSDVAARIKAVLAV
ncbi:MAG: transketolase C-terminal domain-containing protein [Sphaerochaeta sp.]|jgi:transketolase|uniref:transketolase family protein n=1 Tax=Sphaerochaeta sp. TaxID=1972642 RepID=UPI002587CA33|nr:transketolase C-terminal domain-containing protein [Sphaerochaeta sp.]MDD2395725.1 transketolase C-terminal domain-containing protein [Sphaerochaeta sp.]MDD3425236.1 transketolase C-terminal domain-containing protein [Sphaerochaeta sp.]MDD4038814.1 transketolase C-terminal domain-containing protein [Sphaerochaeta sp.]